MEYKPIVSDDVTELILDDHATFRRLFARIDDAASTDELRHLWSQLSLLLSAHAVAEEESFYPELLKAAHDDDDVRDAIKDHNEIRDAVRDAGAHDVTSPQWRDAVKRARDANSKHMAEEERGPLAIARKSIPMERRVAIGLQFLRVRNAFPSGDAGAGDYDKDPNLWVKEHKPAE